MKFAVVLYVFSVLLLANRGLSRRTKRLHGEYYYTVQTATSNDILQLNGTEFTGVPFKPCHKHLKRVETLKARPKMFIPLCDRDGYYAPLQCDSSSGNCWCVDRIGTEKAGTRRKGILYCGLQSVQRPCQRHRLRALLRSGLITTRRSFYIPRCEQDGFYSPLQCLVRSKQCWCVDKHGREKHGSRRRGIAHCEAEVKAGKLMNLQDTFTADEPCFRHKERRKTIISMLRRPNVFNPSCDEDGYYDVKQCHAGYCWCADRNGKIMAGTRKKGDTECESGEGQSGPVRKHCRSKRFKALKTPLSQKPFIPLCGPDGTYTPLQCDVFKGDCWCVDRNGREIDGSRTTRTPNCLKVFNTAGKRPCKIHRWYIQQLPFTDSIHLPICKDNGFFHPVQCNLNKNYCWCVRHDGTEIQGSLTYGKPQCSVESTFTSNKPCMRHKEKRNKVIPLLRRGGVFNPSCDEEGYYDVKQCHAGNCWCADRNGKIKAGTRRKGDVECGLSMPSGPGRKPCHIERGKAVKTSLSLKPFIPLCRPDGYYSPLQCDVYRGFCWCVNQEGLEIDGSRTNRTPNCFSNLFNTINVGPCHLLKSHLEQLPTTRQIIQPMCEANGFFQPSQCSENGKYCWCVMHNGTEVEGSVTVGKSSCHERQALTVHTVRGPCEEHLFHLKNLASDHESYVPVCDKKGFYASGQCNKDASLCWCVSRYGSVIQGTGAKGKPTCDDERET